MPEKWRVQTPAITHCIAGDGPIGPDVINNLVHSLPFEGYDQAQILAILRRFGVTYANRLDDDARELYAWEILSLVQVCKVDITGE